MFRRIEEFVQVSEQQPPLIATGGQVEGGKMVDKDGNLIDVDYLTSELNTSNLNNESKCTSSNM